MIANDILLDAFTRGDITPEELVKEPHPSIGWLAWRISRVMDANVSRLSGREQLWIGAGWAARFGMPPEPADYGRSARHTREQVNSFRASAQQLLDYHDATYERMKTYLESLSADELARELDEPQYDPRPTVARSAIVPAPARTIDASWRRPWQSSAGRAGCASRGIPHGTCRTRYCSP